MAGVNTETGPTRQKTGRNGTPKIGETPNRRKKISGPNKSINGGANNNNNNNNNSNNNNNNNAGQQNRPRSTGNSSASTNSVSFGRQKSSRSGNQRPNDRQGRKVQVPRSQKSSNSGRNSGTSGASNGSSVIQVRDDDDDDDDNMHVELTKTTHLPKRNADPLQHYTPQEIAAVGPIFADPGALGFMAPQQKPKPRPVPRYMLHQPRLLVAPNMQPDPWDQQNQQRMLEMESANSGADYQGIYEEFQKMRETERRKMEELGLVDAENITKDLNDAIVFQGTCPDMCPVFERVRRSLENNVKLLEKDPVTGRISRDRAIKAFSRPAAGQPPPMPSDVRPPRVLLHTLDYIVDQILPQLPDAHSFVWDRTRSIRQDFVYQNYYGAEAIDCNERIVRIHLISLHIMAGSGLEYSQQQELEQLNKALQTLTEIYSDVRNHGGICPNEAELRAYHLVSHYRDPELEREIQTLPDRIYRSPEVQLALKFRVIMSQNNVVERGYVNKVGAVNLFVEFFRLVYSESTPLLLAFLLETHFNEIRFYALKSLSRSYHTKGKAFSAESLRQMLGFDTLSKLVDFVQYYEIDTFEENGEVLVDLCNKEKLESKYQLNSIQAKPKRAPAFSPQFEYRLRSCSLQSLVNSGQPNTDLHIRQKAPAPVLRSAVNRGLLPNTVGTPAITSVQSSSQFGNPTSKFGAPAATQPNAVTGSFNLSDFLNSKKNPGAGSSSGGFGQTAPAIPAFDFTASSKALAVQKPVAPKIEEKVSTQVPSFLGADVPKEPVPNKLPSFTPQLPTISIDKREKEKEKEKPKLKNDAFENKNVLNFGFNQASKPIPQPLQKPVSVSAQKPVSPPENTVTPAPAPVPVGPKFLKDHRHFPKALELVRDQILTDVIQSEVRKVAAQACHHQNRLNERKRLIDAFAEELFSAFLAEQTHQAMLASVAKLHYAKNLKKRAIRRIQQVGRRLYLKYEEKRQRQSEVEHMAFKAPSLKRKSVGSSSDCSFTKRKQLSNISHANVSYEDIHERQEQLQQLWQPINLTEFVRYCTKGVRARPENGTVALNCILVAENWNSPYSKWLNTKFSLKVSTDKSHYINQVEAGNLSVSFRSLPKTNFVNEESFRNTPFLVFECGLLEEKQIIGHKSLEHKLARDGGILNKIVQICNRFSYYKVQILIVLWDITNSELSPEKRSKLLQVNQLMNGDNCVTNIQICDMACASADVAEDLQNRVFSMAQEFTGQLSKRGVHKRAELQAKLRKSTPTTEESVPAVAETVASAAASLKAKEEEILKRARDLQKRKYLGAHISANQSADLTNVPGGFRTPNGSFANQTLMNYNNTILGNNTFLHARDASFLKSFANASVMEESTPIGSPAVRSRTGSFAVPNNGTFVKSALPKKVQELRDITASIKARYRT